MTFVVGLGGIVYVCCFLGFCGLYTLCFFSSSDHTFKREKWISSWVMFKIAFLCSTNDSFVSGIDMRSMNNKRFWDPSSLIANVRHVLASGFSSCSLDTWIWKAGGGASTFTLVRLSSLLLFVSVLIRSLNFAPDSTSALTVSLLKTMGNYIVFAYVFLSDVIIDSGMNFIRIRLFYFW